MNQVLFFSAIVLGIWAILLTFIIEGATKSKKIERQLRIQTDLLSKIALHQGVPAAEIEATRAQK